MHPSGFAAYCASLFTASLQSEQQWCSDSLLANLQPSLGANHRQASKRHVCLKAVKQFALPSVHAGKFKKGDKCNSAKCLPLFYVMGSELQQHVWCAVQDCICREGVSHMFVLHLKTDCLWDPDGEKRRTKMHHK